MNTSKFSKILIIFGLFVLICSGCMAPTKKADFVDPAFNASEIDRLYVMPVLDFRIDQEEVMPLDKWVRSVAEGPLKKKGYKCIFLDDRSLVAGIQNENLREPKPIWLADCGPTEARWLLFFALDDVSSKLTFGSTGNAEMSAYIFDKISSNLIWRNKEISQLGQGGLLGMAMKGIMKRSAIEMAAGTLTHGLPYRKE